MKKTLIACGCSLTHGMSCIPYPKLLADTLQYDCFNFAKPGGSNYFIAKQVEHAITLSPDLVIVGTTTSSRYDMIVNEHVLSSAPNFSNFNTNNKVFDDDKVESHSILSLKHALKHKQLSSKAKHSITELINYATMISSFRIKEDQDRFMLLGAVQLLKESNIPFIVIDFSSIFVGVRSVNSVHLPFRELARQFPIIGDEFHYNQDGHEYVSKLLFETLIPAETIKTNT